eukprot:gene36407-44161_t
MEKAQESDEWIHVVRKSRSKRAETKLKDVGERRNKGNKGTNRTKNYGVVEDLVDCATFEAMRLDLGLLESSLGSSSYFQSLLKTLESSCLSDKLNQVDVIVALGLGSFCVSRNAMLQLAMLQLLRGHFFTKTKNVPVVTYDPVMKEVDRELCAALGIIVLNDNTKGRYRAVLSEILGTRNAELPDKFNGKVLYFMPHCPFRLYCNVLWDHWNELDNIVIFGNSFHMYSEKRIYEPKNAADCLSTLLPFTKEVSLWPLLKKTELQADLNRGLNIEGAFCNSCIVHVSNEVIADSEYQTVVLSGRPSEEVMDAAAADDGELF